ncbi:hypothetical protein LINPERHAP2_LOCUS35066, partial [Linum perenne]
LHGLTKILLFNNGEKAEFPPFSESISVHGVVDGNQSGIDSGGAARFWLSGEG